MHAAPVQFHCLILLESAGHGNLSHTQSKAMTNNDDKNIQAPNIKPIF